jgi:hypothetical protein
MSARKASETNGFSKDQRSARKQRKVIEVYAEHIGTIGGDKEKDRTAQIQAVERAGYTRPTTDDAKVRRFMKIYKTDAARQHLAELYSISVPEEPDPVSLSFRLIHEHAVQNNVDYWTAPGRDRAISLAATRELVKIFVPNQTSRVATLNLSAKVERPEAYDNEPTMTARTVLPAGQQITKPVAPVEDDEDADDDGDPDDDD